MNKMLRISCCALLVVSEPRRYRARPRPPSNEEARLLVAAQVLDELRGQRDQAIPGTSAATRLRGRGYSLRSPSSRWMRGVVAAATACWWCATAAAASAARSSSTSPAPAWARSWVRRKPTSCWCSPPRAASKALPTASSRWAWAPRWQPARWGARPKPLPAWTRRSTPIRARADCSSAWRSMAPRSPSATRRATANLYGRKDVLASEITSGAATVPNSEMRAVSGRPGPQHRRNGRSTAGTAQVAPAAVDPVPHPTLRSRPSVPAAGGGSVQTFPMEDPAPGAEPPR